MTIAIGSDHAGFHLKSALKQWLKDKGYEVLDLGTDSEASVDYPSYGAAVGRAVVDGQDSHASHRWRSRNSGWAGRLDRLFLICQ